MNSKYFPGEKIFARLLSFNDSFFYFGEVLAFNGENVNISYFNGHSNWTNPEHIIRLTSIIQGTTVEFFNVMDNLWYPASVESVAAKNIQLRFNDGQVTWVPFKKVRIRGNSSAENNFEFSKHQTSAQYQPNQQIEQGTPEAMRQVEQGNQFFNQKNYSKAFEFYNSAARIDPSYATPHNNMGVVYEQWGDVNNAGKCYQLAIDLKPDIGLFHSNLINCNYKTYRYEDVIKNYNLAQNNNIVPLDNKALRTVGFTYYVLNNYEMAIKVLDNFLKYGYDYEASLYIAKSYFLLNNYSQSYNLANQLLAENSKDPEANKLKILSLLKLDKLQEAMQALNFTISNQIKLDSETHIALGDYMMGHGKKQEARSFYTSALLLDPNNQDADQKLSQLENESSFEASTSQQKTNTFEQEIPSEKNKKLSDEDIAEILKELDSFIGMDNIKKEIRTLINLAKMNVQLAELGEEPDDISMHMIFTGPPGTGKTTIARILGKILHKLGILEKGHVVEVDRSKLVGQYIGHTAQATKKYIDEALGGILFVDEAYTLAPNTFDNDFGKEAIETLLKRMEDDRDKLVVIAAGYEKEMQNFIEANPGLKSRFTKYFHFQDYNPDELFQLFKLLSDNKKMTIEPDAEKLLKSYFEHLYNNRTASFGNGRMVRDFFMKLRTVKKSNLAEIYDQLSNEERRSTLFTITQQDVEESANFKIKKQADSLQDVLDELNNLIGLENVKADVNALINLLAANKKRKELGYASSGIGLHTVFYGPPGTGKTTVARILGKLYQKLELLAGGQVIETDRSALIGAYIGQTEKLTNQVLDRAQKGVLFIDEAYSLSSGCEKDFGKQAIEVILKRMEDQRDSMCVIAAGYTNEMKAFLNSNPGLESRFNNHLYFNDYNPAELQQIFLFMCKKENFRVEDATLPLLSTFFTQLYEHRDENFANARTVRNYLEKLKKIWSARIALISDPSTEELETFTEEDVKALISQERSMINPPDHESGKRIGFK